MFLYSINGSLLASKEHDCVIRSASFFGGDCLLGSMVITGHEDGTIMVNLVLRIWGLNR